jgi:branched-chain amino acid transport system ATP-binding protein
VAILETKNLTRDFGGLRAVNDVTLAFNPGELCSIIGPNGAGKTTLFRMITGLMPATAGTITFRGREITNLPPHETARLGIGQSFQITNIFPNLTVLENVRLAEQSATRINFNFVLSADRYRPLESRAREILSQVHLDGKELEIAKNLSYGEKRGLELGLVLARGPTLVLLDEPTAGVAHDEVHRVVTLVERIAHEKTVLLIEHNMDVVLSISRRIVVMHQGAVLADGAPDAIKADPAVQQAYLGVHERLRRGRHAPRA